MPLSSYQVQWLITRLRRMTGGPQGGATNGDRSVKVELTGQAAEWARESRPPPPPPPREALWPADMADATERAPAVRFEMERRAGSFMRPRVRPALPPPSIPKMRR